MLRSAVLLASALLVSCATTPPPLQTPSGRPEIVIRDASRKAVIDRIVAVKLEKGLQVKSVTDYGIVVTKKIDHSFMASLLYGSQYDSTPEARITYNVVEVPEGIRVFSRTEMITNPGSGFERVSDVTEQVSQQMMDELQQLRAGFATQGQVAGANTAPVTQPRTLTPETFLLTQTSSDHYKAEDGTLVITEGCREPAQKAAATLRYDSQAANADNKVTFPSGGSCVIAVMMR